MQVTQVMVTHAQPMQSGLYPQGPRPAGNEQVVGMYFQPITSGQLSAINHPVVPSNQLVGLHPQQIQGGQYMGMPLQQLQAGPMASMYPQHMYGNQMAGYGYGQQQVLRLSILSSKCMGYLLEMTMASEILPTRFPLLLTGLP